MLLLARKGHAQRASLLAPRDCDTCIQAFRASLCSGCMARVWGLLRLMTFSATGTSLKDFSTIIAAQLIRQLSISAPMYTLSLIRDHFAGPVVGPPKRPQTTAASQAHIYFGAGLLSSFTHNLAAAWTTEPSIPPSTSKSIAPKAVGTGCLPCVRPNMFCCRLWCPVSLVAEVNRLPAQWGRHTVNWLSKGPEGKELHRLDFEIFQVKGCRCCSQCPFQQ
jgi:hypothetical protein